MSITPYWHVSSSNLTDTKGECPLSNAGDSVSLAMGSYDSVGTLIGTSWKWYTRPLGSSSLSIIGGQTSSTLVRTINVANSTTNYTVVPELTETINILASDSWANSGAGSTGTNEVFHALGLNSGAPSIRTTTGGFTRAQTWAGDSTISATISGRITPGYIDYDGGTPGSASSMVFEYSIDSGSTWSNIGTWNSTNVSDEVYLTTVAYTAVVSGGIPTAANVRFRMRGYHGAGSAITGTSEITLNTLSISSVYNLTQIDFTTNAYYLYETAGLSYSSAPTGIGQSVTVNSHFVGQNPIDLNAGTQVSTLKYTWFWDGVVVAGQTGASYTFTMTPDKVNNTLTCFPRFASDNSYGTPSALSYFPSPAAQTIAGVYSSLVVTITDVTNPTIAIVTPTTGYSIPEGATEFPVSYTVSDNVWIKNVKLYVDAVLKTTVNASYPTPLTNGTINVSSYNLTAGSHTVSMTATDENNNTFSTSITVYKPAVALTPIINAVGNSMSTAGGPPNYYMYYIYSGNISLVVTASSFSGVGYINYYIDNNLVGTTVNPTGTQNSVQYNTVSLGTGTEFHIYKVETYTSGGVLLSSATLTDGTGFKVDNTAPTITITSPTTGSSFPGTGTITVNMTTSDNLSGVSSVVLDIDGSGSYTGNKLATDSYNITIPASALSVGAHTIRARAQDGLQNWSTYASISITISAGTKTISAVYLSRVFGNIDFPYMAGISACIISTLGAITGDYVTLSWDSDAPFSTITVPDQTAVGGNNTWTDASVNSTLILEGAHTFWTKLYNANNSLSASVGKALVVDNSIPTGAPLFNVNGSSIKFTGTVSDAITGVRSIEYYIDGAIVTSMTDNISNPVPGASITLNKTSPALSNGLHTPAVKVWDRVGNYFYIGADHGLTTPQVSSTIVGTTQQGTGGIIYGNYNKGNIAFVGTISIDTGIFTGTPSVKVFIDGDVVGITTTPDGTNRIFTTANFDTTTLSAGTHAAVFKLYENGSTIRATKTLNFTVDNLGPTVTSSYNGTSGLITLSAAAADSGSGVQKVDFWVNGNKVATSTNAPYNYAWNSSSLGAGSYQFYVVATDNVNNATSTIGSAQTLIVTNVTSVSVVVTAPTTGSTISGATVAVTATISGPQVSSVAEVAFFIIDNVGNEIALATDATSPYSIVFDTTYVIGGGGPQRTPDGNYTIIARAMNITPAQIGSDSPGIHVQIKNNVSYTITVIPPVGVSWTQTFGATTTGTPIDHVRWFLKTTDPFTPTITEIGTPDTTGSPYSTTYDTNGVPNATYYLYATVENGASVVLATSASVSINISNASALGAYIPTLNHISSTGPTDYRIVFPVKAYDANDNEIFAFNETTGVLRNGAEVKRLIYNLDPEPAPESYCYYEDPATLIDGVDPNPGGYTPWKYFKGLVGWPNV